MTAETRRNAAKANTFEFVDHNRRFPQNVFIDSRWRYIFCESDMFAHREFIALKDLLLTEDRESVLAMINLDQETADESARIFYFDHETDVEDYELKLFAGGFPNCWALQHDRYVCAPDSAHWCAYIEKQEDMAVFAYRSSFDSELLAKVAKLLGASSMPSDFHGQQFDYGFKFDELLPAWRYEFMSEYRQVDRA